MCFGIHPYTVDAAIRPGGPDYITGHIIGDSFAIDTGNECLGSMPLDIAVVKEEAQPWTKQKISCPFFPCASATAAGPPSET